MSLYNPKSTEVPVVGSIDPNRIYLIPLIDILADEDFNCRGIIDPMEVMELSRDIKEKGLISPVLVQPWIQDDKMWRLIAGYRRFKSVRMIQYEDGPATHIPCIIKEGLDENEARILNLSENLKRKDLNILQEALAIKHFKDDNKTEQWVMQKMQMTRQWVQIRYMLLTMPADIQQEAAAGMITQTQIRELYRFKAQPDLQYELIRKIKDAKIKGHVKEVKADLIVTRNKKAPRMPEQVFAMQEIVRGLFGHCLATRLLGWAGGAVSDLDAHKTISEIAFQQGKFYPVPETIGNAPASDPSDLLEKYA